MVGWRFLAWATFRSEVCISGHTSVPVCRRTFRTGTVSLALFACDYCEMDARRHPPLHFHLHRPVLACRFRVGIDHSQQSSQPHALRLLCELMPHPASYVLSDSGSELMKGLRGMN